MNYRVMQRLGYQINVYVCVCVYIHTRVHTFIGIFRLTVLLI